MMNEATPKGYDRKALGRRSSIAMEAQRLKRTAEDILNAAHQLYAMDLDDEMIRKLRVVRGHLRHQYHILANLIDEDDFEAARDDDERTYNDRHS